MKFITLLAPPKDFLKIRPCVVDKRFSLEDTISNTFKLASTNQANIATETVHVLIKNAYKKDEDLAYIDCVGISSDVLSSS